MTFSSSTGPRFVSKASYSKIYVENLILVYIIIVKIRKGDLTLYGKSVHVCNLIGIKGMACIITVRCCIKFESQIWIEFCGKKVNAKSLSSVKSLKINQGDKFILSASGEDEKDAVNEISEMIESGFNFESKWNFCQKYSSFIFDPISSNSAF